jgi:acid phosphatase (class A)
MRAIKLLRSLMVSLRKQMFLFGLFVSVISSQAASVVPLRVSPVHYLSDTNLALFLLAPPPGQNSAEQQADMAEVMLAHTNTSAWVTNVAASERRISVFTFAPVIGSFFQTNRFPRTEILFRHVSQDTDKVVEAGKVYWNRPRPFVVDTNLFDGEEEKFAGSYPSGHSTLATVLAFLLVDIFPEQREAILSKAEEIGWHRVLLAKHYPTDIYAGRVLGRRIVEEFKKNRRFREDFREARLEILSSMRKSGVQ